MTQEGKQALKYSGLTIFCSMVGASVPVLLLVFNLGVWTTRSEVTTRDVEGLKHEVSAIKDTTTAHNSRLSALESWRTWQKELKIRSYGE